MVKARKKSAMEEAVAREGLGVHLTGSPATELRLCIWTGDF